MVTEVRTEQKEKCSIVEGMKKCAVAEELTREMLEDFVQVVKVSRKDEMEIIWKTGINKE